MERNEENREVIFKNMCQQMNVGLLLMDQTGHAHFANSKFLEISGFNEKNIIGSKLEAIFEEPLNINESWQGEVYLNTKEIGFVPRWVIVDPIRDELGVLSNTLITVTNYQECGFDPLTKLPNRQRLERELKETLRQARTNDSLFVVLFLDLDRFKFVNDTLGHSSGDSLLKQVTQRLMDSVSQDHLIARMGGDEFVCVLKNLQFEHEGEEIANEIIASFNKPFMLRDTEIFITTSIGLSVYPYDGDDIENLITNADSAMYRAKKKGRNQIEKAKLELNAGAFERLLIENNLRRALDEDQFALVYQPQLDLKQNQVTGLEALIRWNHPDLGVISPAEFIPIAEETGLIIPIGEWVLRTACVKLKQLGKEGFSSLRVAVNLSAQQFLQKGMIDKLKEILNETEVDPHLLELEITENMIMHDVETAISSLQQLRELGVQTSIDDFGTGYSSLNYLKNFPVDNLKIDRSFIIDIETNPHSKALTKAIATLAHDLSLKVIVEGVETFKQLAHVKNSSCDMIQGYYFSKPLKEEGIVDFLTTYKQKLAKDA